MGKVFYKLELPKKIAFVHPVFHISMKKYIGEPSHIVPIESIGVKKNLSYKCFDSNFRLTGSQFMI